MGPLLKFKASLVVMGPAKYPGLRDHPVSGYYLALVRIRPPGKTWPSSVKESRVEGWRVGRQPMDNEQKPRKPFENEGHAPDLKVWSFS